MPSDRDQIRDLMAWYAHHIDHQAWESWLDLFLPDGSWAMRGSPAARGRPALAELALDFGRQITGGKTRHLITNERIEVRGDEAAYQATQSTCRLPDRAIVMVADLEGLLVRQDGRWLIKEMIFEAAT